MKLRRVVTAFLQEPDGERVLLGRRSDRVRTYSGQWAAISGSIEEQSPREQALTELREETGLGKDRVAFLGTGRRVRTTDWQLGTRWIIHPFFFRCEEPELLQRNWEHTRFRWTEPEQIRHLTTVPKLWETYQCARDAAEAGGREPAERIFRRIRNDTDHGAEELGLWTLDALLGELEELAAEGSGMPDITRQFRTTCKTASELRPSMAPPVSAAAQAYDLTTGCDSRHEVHSALQTLLNQREAAPLESASRAAEQLDGGVRAVTLSYSSTVLAALHKAANGIERLIVGESRPACEGRHTARLAASFGIPVTLVTDAAAASATDEADVLLLGADAITPDGGVVNKMGSRALAAAASFHGCPALFVTTESKIMPTGRKVHYEEKSPDELGEAPSGVGVSNVYFESVPPELVTGITTEHGRLERTHIREKAEERNRLLKALET